jgi:hypothetical protein
VLAVASNLLAAGCYWGFAGGPTVPVHQSAPKNGADSMTELGVVFDYGRVVRVAYARSLQLYGGSMFTVGGQHVVAPLPNSVHLEVTALRFSEEMYLRAMARGYWGSGVRVGPDGEEIAQVSSSSYGGLFGATFLVAGDHEQLGPTGLSLSIGVLVARADTPATGPVTYLAPMALIGFDVFPPLLLYCLFWDDKCPHHLKLSTKN